MSIRQLAGTLMVSLAMLLSSCGGDGDSVASGGGGETPATGIWGSAVWDNATWGP